jgi:hypothetical protein
MAGWSGPIVAENVRAWRIFRTKRRNNRGGDPWRSVPRAVSVGPALGPVGDAGPAGTDSKHGHKAFPAHRLGHHQPETEQNREQRKAKPQPLLHLRPLPVSLPSLCRLSAPALRRTSVNSTNGSSATECLPIPITATAAGITDMPNDGGREQDRRSKTAAPRHAQRPIRTDLKRTTPLQRNMIARRRCTRTGNRNPPA